MTKMLGFDIGERGYSVIAFKINVTTLSEDPDVAKYNYIAEELCSAIFSGINFKDNFEVERLVTALYAASRKHGSRTMIEMAETKH